MASPTINMKFLVTNVLPNSKGYLCNLEGGAGSGAGRDGGL